MNKTKKMPKKKNKVIFKPVVPQGTPRKKTYQILRTNQQDITGSGIDEDQQDINNQAH